MRRRRPRTFLGTCQLEEFVARLLAFYPVALKGNLCVACAWTWREVVEVHRRNITYEGVTIILAARASTASSRFSIFCRGLFRHRAEGSACLPPLEFHIYQILTRNRMALLEPIRPRNELRNRLQS